ncbi:kinase-like domain-containing protein [Rhizoctonia solani]|nr:kinase-like domain-containing protein [Rhizoctonia solani]
MTAKPLVHQSQLLLESFRQSAISAHDAQCMCLPGIRQLVTTTIITWLNSPHKSSPKVLWLADISGSGKSTVAQHIAYVAAQTNQLLCSFFFKKDTRARSSATSVVAHLSHQLAEAGSYGPVTTEVTQDSSLSEPSPLGAFHSHITVPLCRHPPATPSLIIIDALDESGERSDFLSALVQELPLLPATVKVMLTSKPSQDIDEALNQLSDTSSDDEALGYYSLTFDVYGQANRSDISKYITHTFRIIAQNKRLGGIPLPEPWPSSGQRASLTGHANGLLLWVAIAAAHVDNSEDPERALLELLELRHRPNPDAAMDALYDHILQSAEASPLFELSIYQAAVEVVLSADNPLTIREINEQIHQDATHTLALLRPVLQCKPEVRVAHNSFAEYVQDIQKCDPTFLISKLPRSIRTTNTSLEKCLFGRRSTESSYLFFGYPRPWDLVPDIGSQIKRGSVSPYPITHGGFGDIWSASHIDGRKIAIKTLRLHGGLAAFDQHKLQRRVIKELSVWRKLEHPNVLKLLGICALGGEAGMVSEWMPNGNVIQYTRKHKEVEKMKLIIDVVAGLAYLHRNRIIHGDLKGANVVVTTNGTARLVDFGLAKVAESTLKFSTTSTAKGTTRWMAAELMNPDEKSKAVITIPTDIYSLGMTILEIYTGFPPFMEMTNEIQVIVAVMGGGIPKRPSIHCSPELTEQMWCLMKQCWARDSRARPDTDTILAQVSDRSPYKVYSSSR